MRDYVTSNETCKNHSSFVHWFIWSFINRSPTHLIIRWFIWSFIDHSLIHLSIHRFIWSFMENYICWVHTYTNLLFVQLYLQYDKLELQVFAQGWGWLSARGCKHGLPYSSSVITTEVSFCKTISQAQNHIIISPIPLFYILSHSSHSTFLCIMLALCIFPHSSQLQISHRH